MTDPLLDAILNLSRFHRDHEKVDFTPSALRADLAGPRDVPGYLYSAAELIDRAADLLSDSAGLVHDNERRWRAFRARVASIVEEHNEAPFAS